MTGLLCESGYPRGAYVLIICLVISYTVAFSWCEHLCECSIGIPFIDNDIRRNKDGYPVESQRAGTDLASETSEPAQQNRLKDEIKIDEGVKINFSVRKDCRT